MRALTRTRRDIEAAWRSFVVDGELSASVRPDIVRSWQRARLQWHVDPRLQMCPRAAAAEDVQGRAEVEAAFRVASPLVTEFAERLAPDGHVVGYFDPDGVMLALGGNSRTRDRLADVNFAPGACWGEHAAGTNGIGTALVEARPVEVFASEHFVEAWQPWTCASAPVRSRGRVIGLVDITSPWTAHHPALLATAEALARAIEAQVEAGATRRENETLRHIAKHAVRARDEFLAVASHELKTPLTPLGLKLQNLQRLVTRAAAPISPAQLVEALRGADRHVRRVVEFIDDLVEGARVADRPLRLVLTPTDLGAIVRRVVERQARELEAERCDVAVTVARQVVGRWDPRRLEQAFKHLLVNAMKYAPGRIEVEVDADDVNARLRVRDGGPGIAPPDQERIFLAFERAVSYRHVAGFGLGLHVVRQIVEAHGGSVRLDTALGRGSTFAVELPLRAATAEAAWPSRAELARE